MKKINGLIILDGYGISNTNIGNAVKNAYTPFLDKLFNTYPTAFLSASGEDVGLPKGQMGNSEVGHLTIGAGRKVPQDLLKIDNAIKDGDFDNNKNIKKIFEHAEKNNSNVHIFGIMSEGGIHSKISHMYALLKISQKYKIDHIYIHFITDGRDCGKEEGLIYLEEFLKKTKNTNITIATMIGRVYLDRAGKYDLVKTMYDLFFDGVGEKYDDPITALKTCYSREEYDEFIRPILIDKDGLMKENDSVVFFDYRSDREWEISTAIADKDFKEFNTYKFNNLLFSPMTEYSKNLANQNVLFPPNKIEDNLSAVISEAGLKQYHIAETTKYAHVTFFLNGGIEEAYKNEDRTLINSMSDKEFVNHPEMRAREITKELLQRLESQKYDVFIVNYSNPDMVGHTGSYDATIKAVEVVDECVKQVIEKVLELGGSAIVTADHGNAEQMIKPDGKVCNTHTTNVVPVCVVGNKYIGKEICAEGTLSDIAPTLLKMIGVDKPKTMTGKNLI